MLVSESDDQARGWAARRLAAADAALVLVALACSGIYLLKGVGFTLDDWFYLRNAHFDGVLHAAGQTGGDRPIGALVYMLLFGVIGSHPAVIVGLLGLANGGCAVLLRRVLSGLGAGSPSTLVALIWLVLPLRTSLEVWMSTGTAVLATALVLGAALLVMPRDAGRSRLILAAVLLTASTLSYESLCLLGVPVVLGIRAARVRRVEALDWAILAVAPGLALLWAFTHRLDGRQAVGGIRDPLPVIDANFGRGIAPSAGLAFACIVAVTIGSVLVVRAAVRRRAGERWTTPVALVATGWVITIWGVVPYLTYFYSPYGAGDRLNALSAFGAALVWVGLLASLPRRLGASLVVVLLAVGLVTRWQRAQLWSDAGRDGERIVAAVLDRYPEPDRPLLLGPEPIVVDNIAVFIDHSNVDAALQLAYGDIDARAYLSMSQREFDAADPAAFHLFDMRAVSKLDERDGFVNG